MKTPPPTKCGAPIRSALSSPHLSLGRADAITKEPSIDTYRGDGKAFLPRKSPMSPTKVVDSGIS